MRKTFLIKSETDFFHLTPQQLNFSVQLLRIARTHRAGANLYSFFKEFTKFSLPYLTEINRRVKESLAAQKLPVVPMIVFAKGAHYALAQLGESGYEVVGLDWTVRPEEARRLVGDTVSLQVPIGIIYRYLLISVVDPDKMICN